MIEVKMVLYVIRRKKTFWLELHTAFYFQNGL